MRYDTQPTKATSTRGDIENVYKIITIFVALYIVCAIITGASVCAASSYTYVDMRGRTVSATNGWYVFYGIAIMVFGVITGILLNLITKVMCGFFLDIKEMRRLMASEYAMKMRQQTQQQVAAAQAARPMQQTDAAPTGAPQNNPPTSDGKTSL